MSKWQSISTIKPLTLTETHVWRFAVADLIEYKTAFFAVLSDNEKARALAYRLQADKHAYILTHGALRYLLAAYIGIMPIALQFRRNKQGKPALIIQTSQQCIEFNLSHTREYSVIAISLLPVGIDIESCQRKIEPLALAKRFLSQAEYNALSKLPVCQQHNAFIYAWTIKEAWVKAQGTGISGALTDFDVGLDVTKKPQIIRAHDLNSWACWSVNVAENYYGTLITRCKVSHICYYDLLPWLQKK